MKESTKCSTSSCKDSKKRFFSGDSTISRGSRGPVGPRGPKGDDGCRGEVGPRGRRGLKGDAGPIGPRGCEGPAGRGATGHRGPRGFMGADGPVGNTGSTGPTGPTGSIGSTGTIFTFLCITYNGTSDSGFNPPIPSPPGSYFLDIDNVNLFQTQPDGISFMLVVPSLDPYYFLDHNGFIWRVSVSNTTADLVLVREGDIVFDTCSGILYQYNGQPGYTGVGQLIAPTGPTGATGAPGDIGPTGSSDDYLRIEVTGPSYNVELSDNIIAVLTTATTPVTINLPDITTLTNGKKKITIVDEGGNASVNNITIVPTGGDLIRGAVNYVINTDYDSVNLYSNQTNQWFTF